MTLSSLREENVIAEYKGGNYVISICVIKNVHNIIL